jgi:cytochrome P450
VKLEVPSTDVDYYSPDVLEDPYPVYKELRDAGPVVYMKRYGVYSVNRYSDVRDVLADWRTFSSARGVGFNDPVNDGISGSVVGSDPPSHTRLREVAERPLAIRELQSLRSRLSELVDQRVGRLRGQGDVEVVHQLASYLPLTVVSQLVGLPEDGRERMLLWAAAAFDALAPQGVARVDDSLKVFGELETYAFDPSLPSRLMKGGWAERLYQASVAGEITHDQFCMMLQVNYALPSLDTTISATSNLLWLFAKHPDQWEALRRNPQLVPRAVHESLRVESPVRGFSRLTTQAAAVSGMQIPAGVRVLVNYASANRDERHYASPDTFDVNRDAIDHLGFGHGPHVCMGRNLALLEMSILLQALVKGVESFELISARRARNNSLRGFSELRLRLKWAD